MVDDVGHLFICLFAICVSSLVNCLFMCFAHFLIGLVCNVELQEVFIYSRYKFFVRYVICKYFTEQKVLILTRLTHQFFLLICFVLKKLICSLLNLDVWVYSFIMVRKFSAMISLIFSFLSPHKWSIKMDTLFDTSFI
uniref:Uncharacterized protein n=1 Tax=Rousettus aegyptiacus TaxID=9407 RepID=A0A7J8H200_ROUAE|nr:hypothetical protein HJG63_011318 [Rousettus aegyptiacus]